MNTIDVSRPVPQPNEVTRPFWDAAASHRLVHPRCRSCGRTFFPPHLCCPHCRASDWAWEEGAGRGTVHSATVVHRAPQPGFAPPYVIAVVDLDEGHDLMTNVVGVDPHAVRIGQRVRVTWLEVGEHVLPVFEPDEEADA